MGLPQWNAFITSYSRVGLNHLVGNNTISHEWLVIKGVWKYKPAPLSAAREPALYPTHTFLVTLNLDLNIAAGSEPWKLQMPLSSM